MRKERGLTLVELAIVLIVLGILLGIGAGIIGTLIKRVKFNESREIVSAAVEGIVGFATSSGRLPTDAELSSAVRTLKDSYGKDLAYVYDQDLTASSPYGLCGLTSTNITVRICQDSGCSTVTQTINNVAFIVISGNGNYNNQTSGTQGVNSPTTIDVFEYGVNVDNYAGDLNRVEPYDDIVKWVTLHEIQTAQGCEALTITSPSTLPSAVEDEPYSYQLQAKGGRPPYTWSLDSSNPDFSTIGLSLSPDGTISGTINFSNATPSVDDDSIPGAVVGCSGQIEFTVTVTDNAGQSVSQNFTIPVNAKPVEIITNTLPDAYEGTPYTADIEAIGGSGTYNFQVVSGSLPPGLSLNNSTGEITGTPPTDTGCSEGVYNFGIQASSCTTATKGFSITLRDPDCGGGGGGGGACTPMSITPSSGSTFNAYVGIYFTQTILVAGGQPPISNTQCDPNSSCNGLSISCGSTSAVISGTPTAPGTCSFTVSFQDSCSPPQSITANYTVIIGCPTLTGFADTLSNGQVCYPYSGTITALGGSPPYTWALTSGSLPFGVDFCTGNTTQTCTISGSDIIDYPGTYNFNVQVQDACGQIYSQPFSITVSYPPGSEGNEMQDCVNDGGIDIDELPGVTLFYKVNNTGSCLPITGSTRFTLGNEYYIYSDNSCISFLCTLNFCQLWDIEWQNSFSNCRVRIDSNCVLYD